jgi:hypothetical protein
MFHQFLLIVKQGTVQSQYEVAQKMGISPDMVLQIARELTNKGYLKGAVENCDSTDSGCKGCALGSSCHVSVNSWVLTEKGENAVRDLQ